MYRPDWWPQEKNGGGILPVCDIAVDLHSSITGASECSLEEQRLMARCLQWLLDNWKDPTSDFDFTVRKMVEESLFCWRVYETNLAWQFCDANFTKEDGA